jgi:hypothetical protein
VRGCDSEHGGLRLALAVGVPLDAAHTPPWGRSITPKEPNILVPPLEGGRSASQFSILDLAIRLHKIVYCNQVAASS